MYYRLISSTKTLTGRLAIFFTIVSCIVGVMTAFIFYTTLQWSEDRVGERRILIDRDTAVQRFIAGESGKIRLDTLTVAYNDISLIPQEYQQALKHKQGNLGELRGLSSHTAYLVYKSEYIDQGETKPIVLLSLVDKVEFEAAEMAYSGIIVISLVSFLMFIFGTVLYRLSKQLIEPLNEISQQLDQHSGDTNIQFNIRPESMLEFHGLTSQLNSYRSQLNAAIKREQAFARYASHELRSPLTVVKGANKLLQQTDHNPFQSRQITRINDATNEMITMVDALLSIVRYERSIDDNRIREVPKEEFDSILASNFIQADDKKIDIKLDYLETPSVKASPAVMNMILGNLIRNAIAASKSGTIDVQVDRQRLTIIDDGPGLNEQPNKEGHGLGLLIVDDLCRRYQWQFTLVNHSTRGSQATIIF